MTKQFMMIVFAMVLPLTMWAKGNEVKPALDLTTTILGAQYDSQTKVLSLDAAYCLAQGESLQLLFGPCRETYPMSCDAHLVIVSTEDRKQDAPSTCVMDRLEYNLANFIKPSYLNVFGEDNTLATVFVNR